MSRRGSGSSFSSSSDVNFDDLDDQQVFGFLEDDDESRSASSSSRSRSPSADFRLDFSSRISASRAPPPPMPAVAPNKPVARKSVATTKPRSPSFASKKRIAKRPSSLAISSPASKLFSQKRADSAENMLQTSASSKDSDSDSLFELATTAATIADTSEGRAKSFGSEQTAEIPVVSSTKTLKSKVVESSGSRTGSGGVAPLGNSNALVAALASLQAQVELLTSEKAQMETEAVTTRATIQNLEQKLAASEQSSDLFAQQLDNVKESFQAKVMAREEEISLEKMTLAKDKETQLQHQQARFNTEAELWKHEIAALTKVKLELENENDRLNGELNNEVLQRGFAEAKNRTLKAELDRTSEELQMLGQEQERFERAQIEILELRAKMHSDLCQYELQRQQLENRADSLLLERDGQAARWERERQSCHQQHEAEKAKLLRFVKEVRGLHHVLQASVTDARERLNNEFKKTKDSLESIQQQASEFAVHQSDRDVALMSRKGRILQLETQLKNDRQTINQLESTLAKSTRVLEKKHATLKAKFQEQKEHLEITLAVRQGLTTDLQTKRKQVSELEREVARLTLAKGKTDVKLKHAQQQIQAMQKVHACEMEKFAKKTSTGSGKAAQVQPAEPNSMEENNEVKALALESPEEPEWREFIELVAAYEAERQLHISSSSQ
ncbi:Vacuolar protein 8 [Phytophthora cinnamomi]|uniref:Vacuolar protein 8 n=1 Tax=Phytophthora cinnamomi TaxID=4785 RepID=UPI003559D561|nr:Vacuolar protein 8 [Phytophthora cinnamomi]